MNKKLHKALPKQSGMTLISWLIVIGFLLFQGIMAMNIVPVYVADSSVKSMMKNLATDATLSDSGPSKIREVVMRRLKINNVYDIKKDNISIKRARDGYLVTIEYEPRGKLIGSLDFIVSFKHEALVRSRQLE